MNGGEEKVKFNKETFITRTPGNIKDKWTKVKDLGSGSYGKVYRVENKITKETRACKELAKKKIADLDKFNLEISIMSKCDHPSIINLYEIYEDERKIYLIMEECCGGELFDRILSRIEKGEMYSEKQAASIFKQLMSAVAYCHSQGICHRDLKPENILFLTKDENSPIKVIDFGLSKIFGESKPIDDKKKQKKKDMSTRVGTAYYVSPEVLKGNYDEKCDIWSAGVILYIMLSGDPPFNGESDNDIYRAISKKKYSFPESQWKNISKEAIDLISHMICDPDKRYSAQQVLEHPWIVKKAPNAKANLSDLNVQTLKKYRGEHKLKKAVLTFIASRLNDEEVKNLNGIFENLDENKDGTLTFNEVKKGIEKLGKNELGVDVGEIFKSIDTDGSGRIDYTEFLAACINQKSFLRQERLNEAFQMLDKDGTGKITKEEIKKALKLDNDVDENVLNQLIKKYDLNGDGMIDYNEFLNMMNEV